MKKLCVSVTAVCVVALLANNVFGLNIRVAPKTLVLSSDGGSVTVHTDVPYGMAETVSFWVNGTEVEVRTYWDDRGNLVAQCSKEAVKGVVGEIDEKFIVVAMKLVVNGDEDSEDVRVKQ